MRRDGAERIWSGRLFNSVGAWVEKALSPKVRTLLRGMASRSLSEDRRDTSDYTFFNIIIQKSEMKTVLRDIE